MTRSGKNIEQNFEDRNPVKYSSRVQFVNHREDRQDYRSDSVPGALAKLDGKVHFLAAAINGDVHRISRAFAVQNQVQIKLIAHLLTVDGDDDVATNCDAAHAGLGNAVAAVQTCGSSGTATGHGFDQQAVLNGQVQSLGKPAGHGERLDAE